MDEQNRKRGRPIGRNKSGFCGLRLSDEEAEMLEYITKIKGVSKSDILLEGLKLQYEECKSREEIVEDVEDEDDWDGYYDDCYYEDDEFDGDD